MQISYQNETDLLYIRFETGKQNVTNKRVTEDVVFDIGKDDKNVGIEIMEASKYIDLETLMPAGFERV